jgi:putative salt-induced outer membrane protein
MSFVTMSRHAIVLRCGLGAMLIAGSLARADDIPPGWSGKGQLGYVMSRGNSDTDAANAKIEVNLLRNDWKHNLLLDGLYGRSAGIASAERWDARLQSNYTFTPRWFAFGALSYENDRFSGFQYQATGSGGLGLKLFDSERTRLSLQAGVGYRSLRPEIVTKDPETGAVIGRTPLGTDTEVVATTGLDLMHQFNASTKVTDKLSSESGSTNTSVRNDLALEVKMSKKLSLAAGFSVLENTNPPIGVKQTDTITTLNVVYAFPEPT